ncbi:MAG TPA: TetR/AcrR family transcriptional regulator [Beutenbergiaceae bacterium]|nr:TetR/AcrR family transcriptional regulator [Beutenbergiaceae bacterium]
MDPRIVRTRQSLRDALFALARDHDLDQISIGAIAEQAGVNRSTFYQHYADKDTLLADALDAVTDSVVARADTADHLGPKDAQEILMTYLRHIEKYSALYRQVLGDTGSATVQSRVRAHLEGVLASTLEAPEGTVNGLPLNIAAASIAGAAVGIIRAWLALGEVPPHTEAGAWIWQMLHQHGALPESIAPETGQPGSSGKER